MITAVGMIPGRSTCRIRCSRVAPSILADSYSAGSIPDSAAR